MRRSPAAYVREAGWLLAVSALLSGALAALGPDLVPLQARGPASGRILRVDTKGMGEGALPLRLEAWEEDFPGVVAAWRPGVPIRVKPSAKAGEAEAVARRLRKDLGFERIQVEVPR